MATLPVLNAKQTDAVREIASSHQVPALVIGRTIADHRLEVRLNGKDLFAAAVSDLFHEWDTALERMLEQ